MSNCSENMSVFAQILCVVPECINLFFLLIAIYGMYVGIEIHHPLYAIMFLDLIVALIFTLINIVTFFVVTIEKFIQVSNACNCLSLFFHFTCWCLASCIRFVYIAHSEWIHSVVPSAQKQYKLAVLLALLCWFSMCAPLFLYGWYLGK